MLGWLEFKIWKFWHFSKIISVFNVIFIFIIYKCYYIINSQYKAINIFKLLNHLTGSIFLYKTIFTKRNIQFINWKGDLIFYQICVYKFAWIFNFVKEIILNVRNYKLSFHIFKVFCHKIKSRETVESAIVLKSDFV